MLIVSRVSPLQLPILPIINHPTTLPRISTMHELGFEKPLANDESFLSGVQQALNSLLSSESLPLNKCSASLEHIVQLALDPSFSNRVLSGVSVISEFLA